MEQGIVEFSWTLAFQLLNIAIWIGIIYLIFSLAVKLPKRIKKIEEKIERIESMIEKIYKN
ncbi:hypothetical protein [Natronincola ferrireducens]|uniref:CcmD family protein n=1 Tax=Natronincola ferrireducens TaxID=393762 RepID=A0A1G8YC16_9FIRM|nr:hypothetical protein [Natronincola ferrireducens]SDK00246.1 hypothetical protein SAMN05660472_00492 [Natronincola ferrireducens]